MRINETVQLAHETAKSKGFWEGEKNTGEMLALIHSEISEALEADREERYTDADDLEAVVGITDDEAFKIAFLGHVKDSFEDELADAVIRIFDLAGGRDIDLSAHIAAKLRYNAMRPKKHGKKY